MYNKLVESKDYFDLFQWLIKVVSNNTVKNYGIHFTDGVRIKEDYHDNHKLGFNPKTRHNTPYGIYFYPLWEISILDKIKRTVEILKKEDYNNLGLISDSALEEITDNTDLAFPYMNKSAHAYAIEIDKSSLWNLNTDLFLDKSFKNKVDKYFIERISTHPKPHLRESKEKLINIDVTKMDFNNLANEKYHYVYKWLFFWIKVNSENTMALEATRFFRKELKIKGMWDSTGTIHPNEQNQGILFYLPNTKKVKLFSNIIKDIDYKNKNVREAIIKNNKEESFDKKLNKLHKEGILERAMAETGKVLTYNLIDTAYFLGKKVEDHSLDRMNIPRKDVRIFFNFILNKIDMFGGTTVKRYLGVSEGTKITGHSLRYKEHFNFCIYFGILMKEYIDNIDDKSKIISVFNRMESIYKKYPPIEIWFESDNLLAGNEFNIKFPSFISK